MTSSSRLQATSNVVWFHGGPSYTSRPHCTAPLLHASSLANSRSKALPTYRARRTLSSDVRLSGSKLLSVLGVALLLLASCSSRISAIQPGSTARGESSTTT